MAAPKKNLYFYDSSALIDSVRRKQSVPDDQNLFSDDDILRFANEEMQMGILPMVLSKHQGYYLKRSEVNLVANQQRYVIPERALGNMFKDITKQDNSGNLYPMHQIALTDITDFQQNTNSSFYYIEGDEVVILGSVGPSPSDKIVFFYYQRPNMMVQSKRVAVITAIDPVNGIITFSNFPDVFLTSETYDFVQTKSPHKVISTDIAIISTNSTLKTVTLNPTLIPNRLVIGDRLALSYETDVVNAPSELHTLLSERVASRIVSALGDQQNIASSNNKIKEMENAAFAMVGERVSGSPIKARGNRGLLKGMVAGSRNRMSRN